MQWAYKNGLSKNIIVKTSAPKILLTNKKNIKHIESGWTVDKKRKFQSSIENFSIDIYKELSRDNDVKHTKPFYFVCK